MRAVVHHGTTAADLPAIRRTGLRKGTWVTTDPDVARYFAESRAAWNGSTPVVLTFWARIGEIRTDRSGRPECQTKRVVMIPESTRNEHGG